MVQNSGIEGNMVQYNSAFVASVLLRTSTYLLRVERKYTMVTRWDTNLYFCRSKSVYIGHVSAKLLLSAVSRRPLCTNHWE